FGKKYMPYAPMEITATYLLNFSASMLGQILVDHALSYALTATANVLAVYLQHFWKTVKKVPNANETIRFMLDRKEITYTMDMFCSTLQLPVETPKNPFIASATLEYIQPFINIIGYQGDVDKLSAFFTKNLAQPWQTMFKVFNHCLTLRTSGHDQTKINILQIFHAVVNRVYVYYASLYGETFFTAYNRIKMLSSTLALLNSSLLI
ncbi:hypothetical protein Tco_1478962, partial [Tanacetum coccineum]